METASLMNGNHHYTRSIVCLLFNTVLLSLTTLFLCFSFASDASGQFRRGWGGGYRQPPVMRRYPMMRPRTPMRPRFLSPRAPRTMAPKPNINRFRATRLRTNIKKNALVSGMKGYKGQVTATGHPIIQFKGKNYQIPEQGISTSLNSRLLSSASGASINSHWSAQDRATASKTVANLANRYTAPRVWGPTTARGPLPEKVAKSFRSRTYTEHTTMQDTTLYRAYGGKAGEVGGFWSRTPPSSQIQARIESALDPKWGNQAGKVMTIKVPAGTNIYEGVAAPQGSLVGGGNQVFIQKVDPAWAVK